MQIQLITSVLAFINITVWLLMAVAIPAIILVHSAVLPQSTLVCFAIPHLIAHLKFQDQQANAFAMMVISILM